MAATPKPTGRPHPVLVFAGAVALVAVLAFPILWLTRDSGPVASGTSTTTTAPLPPTSEPAEVTTTSEGGTTSVPQTTVPATPTWQGTVFVYQDPKDTSVGNPALVPLPVEVMGLDEEAQFTQALAAMESSLPEAMFSAIPPEVQVVGLTEEEGVLIADMNQAFGEFGSGSFAELTLLDQLIYNLTVEHPDAGVLFTVGGVPVEYFGGHGIDLTSPVTRMSEEGIRASIFITEPIVGGEGTYRVVGLSNVFEATVHVRVISQEAVVYEDLTTATCGTGCWGEYEFDVPTDVVTPGESSVQVFTYSPRDGSMTDVITVPIPSDGIWTFTSG